MFQLLNMAANWNAIQAIWRCIAQFRELLWEMTRRDVLERQAGLAFAQFWVFGQPLLTMIVYVFVFSFIFRMRLGVDDSGFGYTAYLLMGLVPWIAFQEAIGRAPTCITENRSLIKQIVFPVEILPLKIVLSTVLILLIGLIFPLALQILSGKGPTLSWLLLPAVVFCQLVMMTGLVYILSSLGVFVRDIRNIVQLALMLGMFLHPILYAPGMAPPFMNLAFQLSPLSHVIWLYRDALLGDFAHPWSWVIAPLESLFLLAIGFRMFRGLRHSFGDAL